MNAELIAILGVGASLAALIVGGQRSIRADLKDLGERVRDLGERVARLEGAFPFIAARLPEPPKSSSDHSA